MYKNYVHKEISVQRGIIDFNIESDFLSKSQTLTSNQLQTRNFITLSRYLLSPQQYCIYYKYVEKLKETNLFNKLVILPIINEI